MPAPSGPLLCKVGALVELLSILDGHPVDVPLCDEPAVFSVGVMRKRPGQDVEIWTQVCSAHEPAAALTPGYVRSIGLRWPKSDPDPIGVVEGDTADEQRDNAYARYERDD